MAHAARSDAVAKAHKVVVSLENEGISGILEHEDFAHVLKDLIRLNKTEALQQLLETLGCAVEDVIVDISAEVEFGTLMVLNQLVKDVEGLAAPASDSPLADDFKALAAKLRVGLITALSNYARPKSEEGKDPETAAGALVMLYQKLGGEAGDAMVRLAVEGAMLRMLLRRKRAVVFLRDVADAVRLKGLADSISALADYQPSAEDLDDVEEDEGEGDDEEVEGGEDEGDEDGDED